MSWRVVCDDSFTHADTSTGGAGTTTGVPTTGGATGAWKDVAGSLFNIVSNHLQIAEGVSNGYLTQFLIRPSAEDSIGQQIAMTGNVPESGSGIVIGVGLRYQSGSGNYYLAHVLDGGVGTPGQINVYKVVGGTPSSLLGGAMNWTTGMVSGHTYTLILACDEPISGVTTIHYTVHDETANADVMTGSVTDSEATLTGSGGYAVVSWAGFTGVPATSTATRVVTYIPDVATDFSVSATTSIVVGYDGEETGITTWRLMVDDSFTHADTDPSLGAFNTTSVPTLGICGSSEPWIDEYGGAFDPPSSIPIGFHIHSNKLAVDPINGNISAGCYLLRPPSENSQAQRFIATVLGSDVTDVTGIGQIAYCLRYQATTGGSYFAYFMSNGGSAGVYALWKMTHATPVSNGSPVAIDGASAGGGVLTDPIHSTHTYELEVHCSVPVAGVTTFITEIRDTTAGTIVYSSSVTDNEVSLQPAGSFAVVAGTGGTLTGEMYCSRIRTYIPIGAINWLADSHTNAVVVGTTSEEMLFSFSVVAISRIVGHASSPTVMRVGSHFISATSALVATGVTIGHSIGDKPKSASSTFITTDANSQLTIGSKFVSAMTTCFVSTLGSVLAIGSKFLFATTSLGLIEADTRVRDMQSSGGPHNVIFWDSAQGYTSPIHLSLSGVIVVQDQASSLRVGNRSLSAHTTIAISDIASAPTSWHVSGETSMAVKSVASYLDNKSLVVSASTTFEALDAGSYHLTGPCGAATTFGVSGHSSSLMDRALAAKTGFIVVGAGFTRIDKLMFARTQVGLLTTSGKNADLIVSAASSLVAIGSSKTNMDWSVAATTSIGTSDAKVHKPLYTPHGTAALTVSGQATLNLTGTLAGNTIVVVDVARATRTLNWRPNGLTLPAGGFSPHA